MQFEAAQPRHLTSSRMHPGFSRPACDPAVLRRRVGLDFVARLFQAPFDRRSERIVVVYHVQGAGSARLQIFSPVGMYLQKPVMLTVDQGQPHPVPYTWCLTNTCIAATVADAKTIQEMGSGQTLRLEFVDLNLLALTTSLPLAQFASVNKGAPAQTFEQDIDE